MRVDGKVDYKFKNHSKSLKWGNFKAYYLLGLIQKGRINTQMKQFIMYIKRIESLKPTLKPIQQHKSQINRESKYKMRRTTKTGIKH